MKRGEHPTVHPGVFTMNWKILFAVCAWLSLGIVVGAPLAFLAGQMDLGSTQNWMLAGTIIWFVAAPLWMSARPECRKESNESSV